MKRITLYQVPPAWDNATFVWRADSTRYGVSTYGRTVAEARQRLFVTVNVEKSNMLAYFWSEEFDRHPRV